MVEIDEARYFKIGNREIYFYRDKSLKRNVFGLKIGDNYVVPNFTNDVLLENPEHYLHLVFAYLEEQDLVLSKL